MKCTSFSLLLAAAFVGTSPAVLGQALRVELSAAEVERLGLETVRLDRRELAATTETVARVLDPGPLVALHAELAALDIEVAAAVVEAERAQALYDDDRNVSARERDQAQTALALVRARRGAVHGRLSLAWGNGVGTLPDADRERWVADLIAGRSALLRVELPADGSAGPTPRGRVSLIPRDGGAPLLARLVGPLPEVDRERQTSGWLAIAATGAPALPIGRLLPARLASGGPREVGVVLPRAALVRREGSLWVYQVITPTSFERKRVAGGHFVADGWFVSGGFVPGAAVVTGGVADLLAAELAAASPSASEGDDGAEGDEDGP